ncbi:aminotransferase class V-fold PLP-dependent enzyme [Candidatus Nomurabacteria bacterium]|nr:aminotransferase class V-fold PLP-dependent enzyme [Candidatus Nomurabacteria bacterium]
MFFKPFLNINKHKRIYLDYASSTPVDQKMVSNFPRLDKKIMLANPSALHKEAVALKKVLSESRVLVAKTLGAQSDEIIFTSNASESDNLAILGFIKNKISSGVSANQIAVYISPFEHSAIESLVNNLDKGIRVCKLVQENGYVLPNSINIPEEIKTVLISVMFVQNEIGTVQNIKEIAKRVRKLKKEYPDKNIVFHTDATQAPLFYDLNVLRLVVDMMTLGATKLYTNKGVGMLYKKRGINLSPIFYGGGQEMGLRPGTEPVELIRNFTHALSYAQKNKEKEFQKIKSLQEYFENKIKEKLKQINITGAGERSPHITHLVIPNIDSELLVIELDANGIALSSKSACKNDESQDSGILNLLYPNQNLGAIRVSYGRKTTKGELNKTIKALDKVLKKYNIS